MLLEMLLLFRFLFMLHLLLLLPVLLVMAGVSHSAQISITVMGPRPGSAGCTSLIPSAGTGVTQPGKQRNPRLSAKALKTFR